MTDTETRPDYLVLAAAFGYAAVAQGAFYRTQSWVVLAAVLLAGALALLRTRPRRRDLHAATVGALALAATTLASGTARDYVAGAWPYVLLLVGAALVTVTVARSNDAERDLIRSAVTVAALIVAGSAWLGTVFRIDRWAIVAGGLWRGASTLTYANATGAFLAVSIVAVGLNAKSKPQRFALLVMTAGMTTTLSRGSAIAFALGVAVVATSTRGRHALTAAALPITLGLVAGAATVIGMPVERSAAPAIAIAALLAACALLFMNPRPLLVYGAVAVAAVATLSVPTVRDIGRPVLEGRVALSSEDRSDEWRQAWRLFDESKVWGTGPGQNELEYVSDGQLKRAIYVHNEYLQVASEAGVIAFLAMAAGLIGTLWQLRRTSRFVLGGLVALGTCAFLDFVWHYPLLVFLGALLVGLGMAESEREDELLRVGLAEAELDEEPGDGRSAR